MNWDGKSIFLTGASSGIGRYLAVELAEHGSNLALAARREEQLEEVADAVREAGGEALVTPLDVTDRQAVEDAIDRTVEEFGGLDLSIANAGVDWITDGENLDVEETKQLFDINVNGVVHTIGPSIDHMLEDDGGRIVVVSSLASFYGLPKQAAYCASKSAVRRFVDGLRFDLPDQVQLSTIFPGYVRTPMSTAHHDEEDMMFLVEAEDAVVRIRKALERGDKRFIFPFPMKVMALALSMLPHFFLDWLIPKISADRH